MKITFEFDSLDEAVVFLKSKGIDAGHSKTPVRGSGLNVRAENILTACDIKYVEDAQALGLAKLLMMPNMGRNTASQIMCWTKPEVTE